MFSAGCARGKFGHERALLECHKISDRGVLYQELALASGRGGRMAIQTVLADDEPLARRKLRQMLSENPGVEVAGESASAFEVLDVVRETSPQLLFLDVCMPGLDGFSLMDQLNS